LGDNLQSLSLPIPLLIVPEVDLPPGSIAPGIVKKKRYVYLDIRSIRSEKHGVEKTHFGTVGSDAHIIRVSFERDIHFSRLSYRKHIFQGSWGWIDNCLGDKCNSLFIQKETAISGQATEALVICQFVTRTNLRSI
jgi:hypothetical protein